VLTLSTPSAAPAPDELLSVDVVPDGRRGRAVVRAVGEVDTYTAPLLQACLDSQAGRPDVQVLVVDLEQVGFLDAAGVTVLVRVQRHCRAHGARLVLRRPGDRTRRLLQLTGLADLVPTEPGGGGGPRSGGGRTAARPRSTPRRPVRDRRPRVGRPA
jgi:anti-anti-sigma factor